MTIKRRLFISNILMVGLPILLTTILVVLITAIFISITGIDLQSFSRGDIFYSAVDEAESISKDWTSDAVDSKVRASIDEFNKKYQTEGISIIVYQGNQYIYPQTLENNDAILTALRNDDNITIVMNGNAVHRFKVNSGILLVFCSSYQPYKAQSKDTGPGLYPFIGMGIALVLVFAINLILTRRIINSIIKPLDTLTQGVKQIRDGNLTYRIEYKNNDEFSAICADFNEMAKKLYDMVNARQKDYQSRQELIAGISHDLRTPLTSIKAYIEGLEKGIAASPETRKRYFEIIKNKTSDLEYIINQLFLFTKLDIGDFPFHMEVVELDEELLTFFNEHEHEYRDKGLNISLRSETAKMLVEIDIIQFRNVIHNVLTNSVKYKASDHVDAEIFCKKTEQSITIIISDNGPGVPEDKLENLFETFYRGDASRKDSNKGSGIGLAITKKIIERFNGEVHGENVKTGGLAIIITLPEWRIKANEENTYH